MLKEIIGFKTKKIVIIKDSPVKSCEVKRKFESSLKAELDFRRRKLNENNKDSSNEDDNWSN